MGNKKKKKLKKQLEEGPSCAVLFLLVFFIKMTDQRKAAREYDKRKKLMEKLENKSNKAKNRLLALVQLIGMDFFFEQPLFFYLSLLKTFFANQSFVSHFPPPSSLSSFFLSASSFCKISSLFPPVNRKRR